MKNKRTEPSPEATDLSDAADLAKSRLQRARFVKRADVIADEIKRWIVTEGKVPGDKLPQESELTDIFGTSRWTIREALKALEVQGLIAITSGPRGGAYVAQTSERNAINLLANYFYFQPITVAHLYDVRVKLEPMLARAAVGHLTEQHFAALEETIAASKRPAVTDDDRRQHREVELEFHDILADACPNPLLGFAAKFVNGLLKDWVVVNRVYVEPAEWFTAENIAYHEALVAAFRRADADEVERIMSEHVCSAREHTVSYDPKIVTKLLF